MNTFLTYLLITTLFCFCLLLYYFFRQAVLQCLELNAEIEEMETRTKSLRDLINFYEKNIDSYKQSIEGYRGLVRLLQNIDKDHHA